MVSIEGGYISADGHFVEPADLWTARMDKRFRDRAPRVEAVRMPTTTSLTGNAFSGGA